jgi:hypothetical protein
LSPYTQYAIKIRAKSGSVTGAWSSAISVTTNSGITVISPNTPIDVDLSAGQYAAYQFTPEISGEYRIFTGPYAGTGASNDTYLELYTNASLTTRIAYNDDFYDNGATVRFSQIIQTLSASVTYYIKLRHYNSTSAVHARITLTPPVSGTVSLAAEAGESYYLEITAANVTSFSGKTFSVSYPDDTLQMSDFAAQIQDTVTSAGAVPGTSLTFVSNMDGALTFTVNKTIASGKSWNGVLTIIKFTATESGDQEITVSV